VRPKDESSYPPEIQEIREHLVQSAALRKSWIDRLKSCFE
jgi:hypothetical protein